MFAGRNRVWLKKLCFCCLLQQAGASAMFSFQHADVITEADDDVKDVEENESPTTAQHQLWGSSGEQCSVYNFVEALMWPADSCGWLEHAAEPVGAR